MPTVPTRGITVSFANTPQANADLFTTDVTQLTEDNLSTLGVVLLNVMANDLGGNAKTLYALDDGINSAGMSGDLLLQDACGVANLSAHGATIRITEDGRVSYDASTLDPSFVDQIQSLSDGEYATDTFTYAIRLGNGALSWSTATVQIAGANDAPLAADIATDANEDTGNPVTLTASYVDPDAHDTHTVSINTAGTKGSVIDNGNGTFSYDPNGKFESLSEGTTATDTFTYTVTDSNGAHSTKTATVTIHGENDAPALQAAVGSEPVFGEDSLSLSATMAFSDIDLSDIHRVTFTALGTGYIGDFTPTIATDSTGGIQGSVALSYHLTKSQFEAANGFPDVQDYRVTIDDYHGGISSQIVSIPLGEILSQIGGDNGGGPTQLPPVFINIPPPPNAIGHNRGQITDNPFTLHPSFIPPGGFITPPTDLMTDGFLDFADPDGGSHHVSVDLAHAFVLGHSWFDSQGVPHFDNAAVVSPSAGTWHFDVQGSGQPSGQVHWSYTLNENAIRALSQGELESIIVPVTIIEDGVGQSTTNVRIDLVGTDEPTSLLAPGTVVTASTNITPLLQPIDLATHVQTQNFDINEDPLVTGSASHHRISGTITYVDPDHFDRPTVTMTVADMTHSLDLNPGDGPFNAAVQPLMAGFSYTVESFGNYGMIHWTYDVQDSALDFLAQASVDTPDNAVQGTVQTASANFTVGTIGGGSSSVVNINLHGANDAVVISGDQGASFGVGLHGSVSGSFTTIDPDVYPDFHKVDFVPLNPSTHGFMFGGTPVETGVGGAEPISWNYVADFGAGTLVVGQHDIWNVLVTDHSGSVATYTLDFHIV